MKTTNWIGRVAIVTLVLSTAQAQTPEATVPGAPAQPQAAVPANLSPGAAEVVRLASSGVSDDVVLAYIQNSQAPFNLSAENVLYLKDLGVSPQVTSAMLSHDSTLRTQPQQYAPVATAPAPATAATAPPATTPAPATAPPPTYVGGPPTDVTYFYNALSPYGTWVYLEGYGWCWQPRAVVISPGWRPYCDGGYWVYSDAGWYWQSTYSWGWAPFHYGRWYAHPRCGWVWFPGRVWGPAWVTWRVAGNYCGWAPLPPHAEFDVQLGWRFNGVTVGANFGFGLGVNAFAFVSFGNLCSHDIHHNCLPPAQVNTVYKQTTVVNNYVVVNKTVVHQGIPVERVAAASRSPIPRAALRDAPAGAAGARPASGAVVYRHPLAAPARPVNMVAEKVDPQHPVIRQAPITPGRAEHLPSSSRSSPAPTAAAPGRSTYWSSEAKHESVPSTWAPARTSQAVPTVPPGPKTPRAPTDWKQGTRAAPGYRSDAGLPALHNTRNSAQSESEPVQTPAARQNPHVYYPKSYHQLTEFNSSSRSTQPASHAPSSRGKDSEAPTKQDR